MTNTVPRLDFLLQALYRHDRVCPHCAGRDTPVVARKRLVVRVRRCASCDILFTDPIYESRFGSLYDGLYEGEGSTTEMPSPERLRALLASSFRGTDKDAHERLERLRGLAQGPRLLELGSSWGYFLHQSREHGFQPVGIELSDERREFGRRELRVRVERALEDLGDESFDLIYTSHALEHFTDLRGVLPALKNRLEPLGILAIEVPNVDLAGRGKAALAQVGAVHPLGFTSAFFERNLPPLDLAVRGFYERWEDVPGRRVAACRGPVVIVIAERWTELPEDEAWPG